MPGRRASVSRGNHPSQETQSYCRATRAHEGPLNICRLAARALPLSCPRLLCYRVRVGGSASPSPWRSPYVRRGPSVPPLLPASVPDSSTWKDPSASDSSGLQILLNRVKVLVDLLVDHLRRVVRRAGKLAGEAHLRREIVKRFATRLFCENEADVLHMLFCWTLLGQQPFPDSDARLF